MLGKNVEFVNDQGMIQKGTITELNGDHVIVKDEMGRLWRGSLSQLLFKENRSNQIE